MEATDLRIVDAMDASESEDLPSAGRVGLTSALSVVGGIGLVALGLVAIVLIGVVVGLLIVLGSLPLWGWACVQNKTLYS